MITQQQRKELTLAAVDCEHQINADCIRLWRDPTKEGTALAQLMDRIEAKVRQYIEQGAQPGVDVVMTERQIRVITFALHRFVNHAYASANVAAQDKRGNFYSQGAVTAFLKDAKDAEELLSKKPYATLSAAPQPQQEQSK